MRQQPVVVGLKLCQHTIVQEGTRHVTLVNCFRKLTFADFPAESPAFRVCIVLTDGMGEGTLALAFTSLEDMEVVWNGSWKVVFDDPVEERWLLLPVAGCAFPRAGKYEVGLTIDGELATRTVLRILES